jgi:O-antigen/teichoic acid export membrane protein
MKTAVFIPCCVPAQRKEEVRVVRQSRVADAAHAARSGAVQILTVFVQVILPVAQVIIARLFGSTVFGLYQSSLAIIEVLTRGSAGGADKAMLRYIAGLRARGDRASMLSALGTGLRLAMAVAGSMVLLLILAAPWLADWMHAPLLARSLPAMAPAVFCLALVYVLIQASLANKVTRPNFLVRGLCEPMFLLLAGLGAAVVGRGLLPLALAYSLAAICTLATAIIVVGRHFGPGDLRGALRAPRLAGLATFSLPLGASEMVNGILQRTDIVMVAAFTGARSAGIYAAAEFMGRAVANIRYAFDSITASVLSEALHLGERERLRYNLALMTRWVATVAAPIAVLTIALRADLLGLYGPEFATGATAMSVLVGSHLINATLGLTPWLLMVSGRSRFMLAANCAGATLNILLGLLLIPRFGILGMACAVATTMLAFQVLQLWWTWRTERVHPFEARLCKPFAAAALMLVAELHFSHLSAGFPRIGLVTIGGMVVYVLALLALGLANEERALLLKLRGCLAWTNTP